MKTIMSFSLPEKSLIFEAESTGLSYARFSLLSHENARHLIDISRSAQRKWLASYRNLAFEISMRPVAKDSKKYDAIEDSKKYTIFLTLTLGPTFLDQAKRLVLVNCIRSEIGEKAPLEKCSLDFTQLIKRKHIISNGAEIIPGDKLEPWVCKNIFTNNNGVSKINEKVLDVSVKVNIGLNKFFNLPEIIEIIKLTR